ncbi:MAG: S8 family serine peptidase [Actinomycetota bacterium]|nr:S8 family serine peptidase [Actinomycetota bacterium]
MAKRSVAKARRNLALTVLATLMAGSALVAVVVHETPPSEQPQDASIQGFGAVVSSRVADDLPARDNTSRLGGELRPLDGSSASAPVVAAPVDGAFVQRRVIVRFRPDASEQARAAARAAVGARLLRKLPVPDAELLGLGPGMAVEQARRTLAAHPGVAYSEPDFIYSAGAITPNDPRFSSLWGLQNAGNTDLDAPESWGVSTGSRDVTVAIVDTGVAYDHPDLAANIWGNPGESGGGREANGVDDDANGYVDDVRGWDWVQRDNDPRDLHGHGTHVAGTVGAVGNNGVGITGVAWNAGLVPLRVLDANGSGTSSSIASAFSYAGAMGIDVVNASLGGPSFSRSVVDAIERWPDTLFVVAAGNESVDNDQVASYPCNYASANIICVASVTQGDALSSFSNYGATSVDIGAPGSGILSTVPSQAVSFTDGFESGFGERWAPEPAWTLRSDSYGSYLSDSPDGPYAAASNASVRSLVGADLAGAAGCSLRYALRLEVEANDDLLVAEASTDGSTWSSLGSWSGSSGGRWADVSADMSGFDSRSGVFLRFRLKADGDELVGDGADVDDVQIVCTDTSYSGSELATFSGTSMATPHVAGAAAVLNTASPALGAGAVKSALLDGSLDIPALAGRSVTGGRLNLLRSLQQIGSVPVESAPPVAANPTPAPSLTQSQQLEPTPTPLRTPATTAPTATPEAPAPAPTPVSPTPTPSPSPSGSTPPAVRSLDLTVARHLIASGVVTSDIEACRSGIPVVLKHEGRRVGLARTDEAGIFKVRLKDRVGRYAAVAASRSGCPRAADVARHRHRSTTTAGGEGSVAASGAESCWTYKASESAFADATNRARSEAGAAPLKLDPELSKVARIHTREMVATGSLVHSTPDDLRARVTRWSALGENIAVGQNVDALQRAFMSSSAHRGNILSRQFAHVGVGAILRDGRLWVTVIFEGRDDPGTTLRMPRC